MTGGYNTQDFFLKKKKREGTDVVEHAFNHST